MKRREFVKTGVVLGFYKNPVAGVPVPGKYRLY